MNEKEANTEYQTENKAKNRRNFIMANRIILNETSYFGPGAIQEIVPEVRGRGAKKVLVVTDKDLIKFKVATKVTELLDKEGIAYEIYDKIKANPTIDNSLHKQDILRQICFYIHIQTLQIHTGTVNLIDKYNCRDLQLL